MIALASAGANANGKPVAEKKQDEIIDTVKSKRGVFESLGDYGAVGHHEESFGGHDFGGHDFGASEHHHEHVKHVTIEKKIPVPYTVTKHVPYTGETSSYNFVKIINSKNIGMNWARCQRLF